VDFFMLSLLEWVVNGSSVFRALLPWVGTLYLVAWLDYIRFGLTKSSYFSNGKPYIVQKNIDIPVCAASEALTTPLIGACGHFGPHAGGAV
jgi:hypothetical protein